MHACAYEHLYAAVTFALAVYRLEIPTFYRRRTFGVRGLLTRCLAAFAPHYAILSSAFIPATTHCTPHYLHYCHVTTCWCACTGASCTVTPTAFHPLRRQAGSRHIYISPSLLSPYTLRCVFVDILERPSFGYRLPAFTRNGCWFGTRFSAMSHTPCTAHVACTVALFAACFYAPLLPANVCACAACAAHAQDDIYYS